MKYFFYSFLIPPEAYPGRIGLLLTTLLVLINIFIDVIEHTPTSDGINNVQSWLLTCIMFVVSTLMIYALILCQIQFSIKFGVCKIVPTKRNTLDNIALIVVPLAFSLYVLSYHVV